MTGLGLPRCQRLAFRRWRDSDLDLASRLWQSPDVMRFLGGPYTEAQVRERLAREIANDETHGIQYWPIFTADGGEHVGCCGLKPFDPEAREYELGFHLLPRFWGAGYASEAARAVIDFASRSLEAVTLYAGHHPENAASRRVLAGLGFVQIGTHFFAPTGLQHPWYERKMQ